MIELLRAINKKYIERDNQDTGNACTVGCCFAIIEIMYSRESDDDKQKTINLLKRTMMDII